MASRNIANMHLFLEMKTKFPYLPEDTLRNYVFLYAEDQAKCISMLQKESENYFHPGQHFIDYHLSENKVNRKANENTIKENSNLMLDYNSFQSRKNLFSSNTDVLNDNFSTESDSNFTSDTTMKQSSVLFQSIMPKNPPDPSTSESHSAPVIKNSERPFDNMFQSVPDSSHVWEQNCSDQNYENRMLFSTTKEHVILPSNTPNSIKFTKEFKKPDPVSIPKRHAVKLSITPVLPFQQQQVNVYSSALSANASHSSRPGRHTTSVNFQLQPQSSNQLPLEISSVPTGMNNPRYKDFSSHVQISVDTQGTTFTALRLQRPSANVNQTCSNGKLVSDATFQTSSQGLNSSSKPFSVTDNKSKSFMREKKLDSFSQPNYMNHSNLSNFERTLFVEQQKVSPTDLQAERSMKITNAVNDANPDVQISSAYIKAVKRQQLIQLNLVQEELKKANSICSNLKSEINRIEHELFKEKERKISSSHVEILEKLKEENQNLRFECNCLLVECEMPDKMNPLDVTLDDTCSNINMESNDIHSKINNSTEKDLLEDFQFLGHDFSHDDDEKNLWKCKKCTFLNHPALVKCEMCEISKNSGSFFDDR